MAWSGNLRAWRRKWSEKRRSAARNPSGSGHRRRIGVDPGPEVEAELAGGGQRVGQVGDGC